MNLPTQNKTIASAMFTSFQFKLSTNRHYFLILAPCPSLGQIKNGVIVFEVGDEVVFEDRSPWPVGTTAFYFCNDEYSVFGNKLTVTCQQDGTWEESGPITCQSKEQTF